MTAIPNTPESHGRVSHDLPGLDLARLSGWFVKSVPGAYGQLSAQLLAGGKSNHTYEVSDGASTWIIRRPPLGHVPAKAHDMEREYRMMSAGQVTDVPVPRTYAFCRDEGVVGAPFYVMQRLAGTPYRTAAELKSARPERTRMIAVGLVDTLATLHDVNPAAVGLADFGRPEGFLARQVDLWKKQLDASHSRNLPVAAELHARLAAEVPKQSAPGIVHGDYRLENVLTDDHDRPAAVIDWEMATVGDPLTDLALLVVNQRLGVLRGRAMATDPMAAAGFLTEEEIIDRYLGRSDRNLTHFGFYLGLAAFKLAAVLEGIHYRYINGKTVGPGFERVGENVPALLDAGLRSVKGHY
ncbi:phosphotransferase family protein [Nocardia africana]|uniref:Phosphotransferase family protein n=1 Tax=Nocardia africana TaxID=134964 RepID=A0ABW6NTN6_9NOCA